MKFKKKWIKLIKNWTKLEITSKWYIYTIYSNNNLNYYKLIKICLEKGLWISSYDLKLMKNYNSLEIELAILIIETESMNKEEKLDDFPFLKFMNNKDKEKYYEILITEKNSLEELKISYEKEMIEIKELSAIGYQDDLMNNNKIIINPDIIYNNKNFTISYLWDTFIRGNDKYWTMYNYIRIILENKSFTNIEKQFFISFIKNFEKLTQDERVYFIYSDDPKEEIIETLLYLKYEYYWIATNDKVKFNIIDSKNENKTEITNLEQLIIDSKILNKLEKQNYLILINSMSNKELFDFEKYLLKDEKTFRKYENKINKLKKEEFKKIDEDIYEEEKYKNVELWKIPKWLEWTILLKN